MPFVSGLFSCDLSSLVGADNAAPAAAETAAEALSRECGGGSDVVDAE